MTNNYKIANTILRFESETELKQNGFADKFLTTDTCSDINISVGFVENLPYKPEVFRAVTPYSTGTSDGGKRIVSHINRSNNRFFLQTVQENPEHCDVYILNDEKWAADMYYLWSYISLSHVLLQNRALLLHAAYIGVDGEAIIFTAPSMTGKSTQAALWREYRKAEIINGDKCVIKKIDGKYRACGVPTAGTSGICLNKTLPVKAIVSLSQARENKAEKMGAGASFACVESNSLYDKWDCDDFSLATPLLLDMAENIPFLSLACTPDKNAVTALEKAF